MAGHWTLSRVPAQVPLIGFIGRLDFQKGADLVLAASHWLLAQDVQLVCLGTGDQSLEARWDWRSKDMSACRESDDRV